MRSDVQFWTDVAVGRCVRREVSPEAEVWYLLRLYIAQLMVYYRRDIPQKWDDLIDPAIPTQFAYDIADRMKGDIMFGKQIDLPDDEFRAALDDEDMAQAPRLSPWGWQVLRESSGMAKEEWEEIPNNVRATLDKQVTCPKCNLQGKLGDMAVLDSAPDPFNRGSGLSLHFTCEWCGSDLNLDTTVKSLEMAGKVWSGTKNIVFWVALIGAIVTFLGILWALKWK